jgi:argininosuccinate lyase
MKLWGGRFSNPTASEFEKFSSSIETDSQMWEVDLLTSKAHARMLAKQGIISAAEGEQLVLGLSQIQEELSTGKWSFDSKAEDIHGEIERRLFELIGAPAKKIHTARSRNDQVATDTRLFLSGKVEILRAEILKLQTELCQQAAVHVDTILPGMTHLQHAQPISLAHHLLAYFWMFQRDQERLQESLPRILSLPLGSAALAGTGFPIDRQFTCQQTGFSKVSENSLDAVSDRDFLIEFLSNASIIMMHLSRFCEELILWSTPEFKFVELGDAVTTGSSIMPQKKNPDVAELIRGRVGRLYGALMGSLTMMKALPLSYNRDMQEDKVHLFEGIQTVLSCVQMMNLTLKTCRWQKENMAAALKGDFSNATDLADDLVQKGMSFREAHEVIGHLVQSCLKKGVGLEDLTLSDLQKASPLFTAASLEKTSFENVLKARTSEGGAGPAAVLAQLEKAQAQLVRLQSLKN